MIALLSTWVAPEGTQIKTLGPKIKFFLLAFLIKNWSIFSVVVKSAITPSFNGLIVSIFSGVLPSIVFASKPTAFTLFLPPSSEIETTEGSSKTKPLFLTKIIVFAVPKSIDKSLEKISKIIKTPEFSDMLIILYN